MGYLKEKGLKVIWYICLANKKRKKRKKKKKFL